MEGLHEIIFQLRKNNTPPLAVHEDTAISTTWVIYKEDTLNGIVGFPILKVVDSTSLGVNSTIVTRGFLLETYIFNPTVYNATLKNALLAVQTG